MSLEDSYTLRAAQFGRAVIRGLLTDSQLDCRADYDCEITRMIGKNVSIREASSRIFEGIPDPEKEVNL
jgi:hypothetical protein